MNITVNSNAFVKLDKMVGLSEVDIKISDYLLQNNTLKGNVKIFGEYYTDELEYENNNGLKEFEDIVPFEIVFNKDSPIINVININNFEYYEVAGRGIETAFDLEIDYNNSYLEEEKTNEEIKEEVTNKIDELLETKLEVRNDNFLEVDNRSTETINELVDIKKDNCKKTMIKVIYYNKNQEIKDICKKHNLSYYSVLEENKKYRFNDNHRIIISELNGNK